MLCLTASETWTQIGCATAATNWSTASSWKCTAGTGCTSTCGAGDGSHLYPQASGDVATIGAWVTTLDVSGITLGDPANVTTSALSFSNGATLTASNKTLNLVGQGIIVGTSVANVKLHFDGNSVINCTSDGVHVTYCPAMLYSSSTAGTNTIELCGNASCTAPAVDSQGYLLGGFATQCPNFVTVNGTALHSLAHEAGR